MTVRKPPPPRDLRKYMNQTYVRLVIGAILLVFTVGIGLIWWIYGPSAAASGLLCLATAMLPIAAIAFVFIFIDWIIKRANRS